MKAKTAVIINACKRGCVSGLSSKRLVKYVKSIKHIKISNKNPIILLLLMVCHIYGRTPPNFHLE